MIKKTISLIFLLMSSGAIGLANASIIYDLNRTIGTGTVSGYIETDGSIGILTTANITDWELILSSPNLFGGSPQTINFATQTSTSVTGNGLSASATDLFFDFSISNSHFFMQGGGSNVPFFGLGTDDVCGVCTGEYIGWHTSGVGPAEVIAQSGAISFASTNSVPEPTSLALLGLGLAGFGFSRKKKKA